MHVELKFSEQLLCVNGMRTYVEPRVTKPSVLCVIYTYVHSGLPDRANFRLLGKKFTYFGNSKYRHPQCMYVEIKMLTPFRNLTRPTLPNSCRLSHNPCGGNWILRGWAQMKSPFSAILSTFWRSVVWMSTLKRTDEKYVQRSSMPRSKLKHEFDH
jgi:hypothetical protein